MRELLPRQSLLHSERPGRATLLVLALALLNIACNVGAMAFFAASGRTSRPDLFVAWQILGGFFGLVTNITFAGLVRYWSLAAANVIGVGVVFVAVQLAVAYALFHAPFGWWQWLGSAFVFVGLVLIALRPTDRQRDSRAGTPHASIRS